MYSRLNKLQNSFKFQGIRIWNSIPDQYKKLDFSQLKQKHKKFLLSKYDRKKKLYSLYTCIILKSINALLAKYSHEFIYYEIKADTDSD